MQAKREIPVVLNSLPKYLAAKDLKPGDVLIYRLNERPEHGSGPQTPNQALQKHINSADGESQSRHAAIIVDDNGTLKIAHLVSKGFKLDSIDEIKSTINVFRPKHSTLGDLVSDEIMSQKDALENSKWSLGTAFSSFMSAVLIKGTTKDLTTPMRRATSSGYSSNDICSGFVIRALLHAAQNMNDSKRTVCDFINFYPTALPRELHAYLVTNPNWEQFLMPHARADLFATVKLRISTLINKHLDETTADAWDASLNRKNPKVDIVRDTIELLRSTMQSLTAFTESDPRYATLMADIRELMHNQGLRDEYVDNIYDDSQPLDKLAQKHLGFDQAEAEIYTRARHWGMTHKESLLQAKPDFFEWFATHPVKTGLSAATGILMLADVGPRALIQTARARRRLERTRAEIAKRPQDLMAEAFKKKAESIAGKATFFEGATSVSIKEDYDPAARAANQSNADAEAGVDADAEADNSNRPR